MLAVLAKQKEQIGIPTQLLADTGYFSAANVNACVANGIEPMIAMKREAHHLPVLERFTEPPPLAADADAIATMAHRLKDETGTGRIRAAQADGRARVWHHQACDEVPAVYSARTEAGRPSMESGRPRMEPEANDDGHEHGLMGSGSSEN
jgi:hypothetical protein